MTDQERLALEDMARRAVGFAGDDPDRIVDGKPIWTHEAYRLWSQYGPRIVDMHEKRKRFAEVVRGRKSL